MRSVFKRKKIFTLLEVLTVTVIILIVAGLGVLSYRQVVENARQRVCVLNLKVLGEAIRFYSLEKDALPASLGELKLRHLKKAYAKVMREGNYLLNKLAFFIVKINNPFLAYGKKVFFPDTLEKYGVTEEIFHCPSDPSGGISYAMNENLAGKKWEDIAPGTPLVVCTSCQKKGNLFNPLTGEGICGRHFKNLGTTKNIVQAILKGGIIVKGKAIELVDIFNEIFTCIDNYWLSCIKTCGTGKLKCIRDCQESNEPGLIRCVEDVLK